MKKQITNTILMIRPVAFRMNEETAINNYFQKNFEMNNVEINKIAQKEFDVFVEKLRSVGVNVIVEEDDILLDIPDSIFPNNWVSFHETGIVGLYPMFAENRRRERREEIMDRLDQEGFEIEGYMDYTSAENENLFLEGTGSLVLDRKDQIAYCALSPRADEDLVIEFCEDFDYFPVIFTANQDVDGKRMPIYHTNVMMAIAEDFVIICLDTIDDKKERSNVVDHIKRSNKEIITITEEQMHKFAGNMLQVKGANDLKYMVMSQTAYLSLTKEQIDAIERHCKILYSDLEIIETCGGGSARCMMAEVFLPKSS